jgi:hypothetical protein
LLEDETEGLVGDFREFPAVEEDRFVGLNPVHSRFDEMDVGQLLFSGGKLGELLAEI